MSQMELDPQFVRGLRLLHSTNKDSAEQLRSLLDDVIRQKYGASKMLSNTMQKKYTIEEALSDNSSNSSSKKSKSSSSSKHSKTSRTNSPVTFQDISTDLLPSDDTLAMAILDDDLTCVVCQGMDVGARNRLVECAECHSLYHQECHVPSIPDAQIDDPRGVWYCTMCTKSNQVQKEQKEHKESQKEHHSSKSSSSESKTKETKEKRPYSSPYKEKHKSSSSSNSHSQSSNGNNSKVPSINVISAADKRLKDMMKKSKQDKRSSSSSSSKHSSSSLSKSDKSQK